jgi:hypothetical protein
MWSYGEAKLNKTEKDIQMCKPKKSKLNNLRLHGTSDFKEIEILKELKKFTVGMLLKLTTLNVK